MINKNLLIENKTKRKESDGKMSRLTFHSLGTVLFPPRHLAGSLKSLNFSKLKNGRISFWRLNVDTRKKRTTMSLGSR